MTWSFGVLPGSATQKGPITSRKRSESCDIEEEHGSIVPPPPSPFAVSARARDGLDLKPEAPPLFSSAAVILCARLAVEGAGGPQLGQALVLVGGGDLEERAYVTLLQLGLC